MLTNPFVLRHTIHNNNNNTTNNNNNTTNNNTMNDIIDNTTDILRDVFLR